VGSIGGSNDYFQTGNRGAFFHARRSRLLAVPRRDGRVGNGNGKYKSLHLVSVQRPVCPDGLRAFNAGPSAIAAGLRGFEILGDTPAAVVSTWYWR
jgi:hypothetical protein